MSSQVVPVLPVPKETAKIARATFSWNNFYIQMGEHLESILAAIEPRYLEETGILMPSISAFQFLEELTDQQTIDAFSLRVDWKFALHLPVYSPAFHEHELCRFRQKILYNKSCQQEFQRFIDHLISLNHHHADRLRNMNSMDIVITICSTNRLGMVHDAMSRALEALVYSYPEWLRMIALPHWYGRYNQAVPSFGLLDTLSQQELSTQEIMDDISYLVEEASRSNPQVTKELQKLRMFEFISTWQSQKSNQLPKTKDKPLNLSSCDFCIYRDH